MCTSRNKTMTRPEIAIAALSATVDRNAAARRCAAVKDWTVTSRMVGANAPTQDVIRSLALPVGACGFLAVQHDPAGEGVHTWCLRPVGMFAVGLDRLAVAEELVVLVVAAVAAADLGEVRRRTRCP